MTAIWIGLCLAALELSPLPQKAVLDEKDAFALRPSVPIVVDGTVRDHPGLESLFEAIGYELPLRDPAAFKAGSPAIYVGKLGKHPAFEHRKIRRWLRDTEDLPPEGYRLCIWRGGVVVAGVDAAGVYYGLETLSQIVRANPIEWHGVMITDWPALPIRGAYLEGLPTGPQIRAMARRKCNWMVFESSDFHNLTEIRAEAWQRAFSTCRRYHIEPVPLVPTLHAAAGLIAGAPHAAEGRFATGHITLEGDNWGLLEHRNIIHTKSSPIRVSVSGISCQEREDYAIETGGIEAPFREDNGPWLIRRIPGGAIPDGATVTAEYGYVPPGAAALCPYAPETRTLIKGVLADLADTLKPDFVHLGMAEIARINQDARCRAKDKRNAAVFADAVSLIDGLIEEKNRKARVVLWADQLDPDVEGRRFGLANANADLPKDALLAVRVSRPDAAAPRIAWGRETRRSLLVFADGSPATAYAVSGQLAQAESFRGGLLAAAGTASDTAFRVAMEMAWSPQEPVLAWPAGLNAFFGADLWEPDYQERLAALTMHLNRQTLAGVAPKDRYRAFERLREQLEGRLPEDDYELDQVDRLFESLTEYLDIEAAYTEKPNGQLLRRLARRVENQAELDPGFTQDRLDRILETIEAHGLFVPASILFGTDLCYYRGQTHAGRKLYAVPVQPDFVDEAGSVQATADFLGKLGGIARIDFETVGTTRLQLEQSSGGGVFKALQEWRGVAPSGLRGPAILSRPARARVLRLTTEATRIPAVFRELRFYAEKSPANAACSYVANAPKRDSWPAEASADSFLCVEEHRFAAAPTEVRLCRTRTHLFLGVTAYEARMEAMVANLTGHDQPLWEEESVEVLLCGREDEVTRLVVNPRGARYDSRNWDPGWNGDWEAVTEQEPDRWIAVIAVPFKILGTAPKRGEAWKANFKRHRSNVTQETSAWAHDYDVQHPYQYGTLSFR